MTEVDVIIPVFNTPLRFLTEALDSLRDQTHTRWTAWVIDDGSDKKYSLALKDTLHKYNDSRLNYLYTEHKGPAGSRNVGIHKGTAPYVALLDSDDCWLPAHLARQVARLDTDNRVSVVHGHRTIIDSGGQPLTREFPHTGLNGIDAQQEIVRMLKENYVNASSVVVRRTVLDHVGYFDETFPCLVDKELWLRILIAGFRFHYDSEIVLLYRVHSQNISKKTQLLLETRQRIVEKAEAMIKGNALYADLDWNALRREMRHHMYLEAAEAHYELGNFVQALKFCLPTYSGLSPHSCKLFWRSLVHIFLRHEKIALPRAIL